jgi:arylformamidase
LPEKRVSFDFAVEFSNGGGIQGQGFRLDIDGEISDESLAAYIVKDLRLLMVGSVKIFSTFPVQAFALVIRSTA